MWVSIRTSLEFEFLMTAYAPLFSSWVRQPDLPVRVKKGIPFAPYKRELFYSTGKPEGYIDYPFADEETERKFQEKWAERKNSYLRYPS